MNKVLAIISIILFSFLSTANAQVRKGATLLGGNIGGFSGKQSDPKPDTVYSKDNSIAASLTYGKAIRENLILGVSGYWGRKRSEFLDRSYQYREDLWGASVFLRKYKQLGTSAFYMFAQAGLNGDVNKLNTGQSGSITESKTWTISASANPGVSFAVSKKFQIEMGLNDFVYLGYSVRKDLPTTPGLPERKTTEMTFKSSIDDLSGIYFGFRVLLN